MIKFITPRQISDEVWRVSFDVLASPDFFAIIQGFLMSLQDVSSWEQIDGITITPEEAVEIAGQVYETLEVII